MILLLVVTLIVAAVIRHKRNRRTSIHIDWEFDLKPVRVDDYRLTPIPALESEEVTGRTYTREDARRDALLDRGR